MHLTLFLIHYILPSKTPNSFQAVHTHFSTVLHVNLLGYRSCFPNFVTFWWFYCTFFLNLLQQFFIKYFKLLIFHCQMFMLFFTTIFFQTQVLSSVTQIAAFPIAAYLSLKVRFVRQVQHIGQNSCFSIEKP